MVHFQIPSGTSRLPKPNLSITSPELSHLLSFTESHKGKAILCAMNCKWSCPYYELPKHAVYEHTRNHDAFIEDKNKVYYLFILQAAIAGDLGDDTSTDQTDDSSSENFQRKISNTRTSNRDQAINDDDDDDGGGGDGDTDDISGTQCSVYVTQEWGTRQCHNAVVLGVEPAESEDEDVSKYVMQHIERGTLQKLLVSHFITMTMVNGSRVLCCFIYCFVEQVFQETWVFEGWHQPDGT